MHGLFLSVFRIRVRIGSVTFLCLSVLDPSLFERIEILQSEGKKEIRNKLISAALKLFNNFLSLQTDVDAPTIGNKQK
jgi:hypothetical protein